jgi:hypothetical protein
MAWFLTIFFAIYSGIHVTLYARARSILPARTWVHATVLVWCLLMVLAPVIARVAERQDYHLTARYWAAVGFFWMGLAGLAFFNSLLAWMLQLLTWAVRRFTPLNIGVLTPQAAAWGALSLALVMSLYGLWEAGDLRVERVSLATPKLPPGVERLTMVQISDLHLSVQTSPGRLKAVIEAVARAKPDMVFSTGDLVDGTMFEQDHLLQSLAELNPPLGKWAITGNHEYIAGLALSEQVLKTCGFTLLRNRAAEAGGINLLGVDDPTIGAPHEAPLLEPLDHSRYIILLKHRPTVQDDSLGRFDLQLSGHAHRGQVWPFNYVTGALFPLQEGLHALAKGSKIYASRGTGTWGPPMRIFAPPEITIIELVRAGETASPIPASQGEEKP